MRTGRPKAPLTISNDERSHLLSISRSRSLPAALTLRAKIVLACEHESSNAVVATRLDVGARTIGKWRNRFIADRIEGLSDEMRTGRPRTIADETVAELITKTLARKPKAATHWSVRAIAQETGIAKSTVHRLFQLFGLQPHRTRSFKLSTDLFFIEKLRDVVGLYLNPPDKAVVLWVDEKSQIQALERTQPMLPRGFGYIEGCTHDYQRHGTTTLFAALKVLDGAVIAQCKPRHRHQEFLAFLRHIEANVPTQLDIHLVVDNYATHKHPRVRAWLARRPRWHIHFNPAAGRTAAALMGRFLRGRRGSVGVIAGSLVLRDHAERQFGFHQILSSEYPDLSPLAAVEGRDDNECTSMLAARLLSRQPDLVGLHSVGAGNRGIASALEASGRAHDIVWIAHELTVHTRDLLLRGVIEAIINQDPGHEARSAARILLAHCLGDPVIPDQERINIDIFLRDNLP